MKGNVKMIVYDKPAHMCIATNDFISAKARFDRSNLRWRAYWFETCFKIAQKNKEYLEKYLFNEEELTIVKVKIIVKYTDTAPSHTYLIDLLNEKEEKVFTKVGKADCVGRRMNQILDKGYKEADIDDIKILKVFELPTDDLAEALESLMRHYIKRNKEVGFYPKDRFTPFVPSAEDYEAFERMYDAILALA
jgi:thiol-disulfide isomerase/thioredoxin